MQVATVPDDRLVGATRWTLGNLLCPVSEEEFLATILHRSPRLIKGHPEKLTGLLPWESFNELLAYRSLSPSRLRLVQNRQLVPSEHFSRMTPSGCTRIVLAAVNDLLGSGATLSVDAVEEVLMPVSILARSLERGLGVPAQINAYASWRETASLGPQCNEYDVLMLQLDGTTSWRLHQPTIPFPAPSSQPEIPAGPATHLYSVEPGDLVYVPRGWWHEDVECNRPALFLVSAFRNPTGVDILTRFFRRLQNHPFVRMDYPRFGDADAQSKYLTQLQYIIQTELGQAGLLLPYLKEVHAEAEPIAEYGFPWGVQPGLPFSECDYVVVIRTRFPGPQTIQESDVADESVLVHGGRRIRFKGRTRNLLPILLDGFERTLQQVFSETAAEFTREEVSSVLERLMHEGVAILRKTM